MFKKLFATNKSATKQIMLQCATEINSSMVTRETVDGQEFIVVVSHTLPDDIVMNGGLYPATEIATSFHTLERTLSPIEHPTNAQGQSISATDPEAIHNFHAGAFNTNVTQEGGRIRIEKRINVQEAMKSDRGLRLLDRIEELETNDAPRPIHTSVGVFLMVEEMGEVKTNAAGQEYSWIGRDMVFDHDAILLSSVGAAQPNQGVGMAVNAQGKKCDLDLFVAETSQAPEPDKAPAPNNHIQEILIDNAEGISFESITKELQSSLEGGNLLTSDWSYIVDVFPEEVIYETADGFFSIGWQMVNGEANVTGVPTPVERIVTFQHKDNSEKGSEVMKEIILNALKDAGVEIADTATDAEIFTAYNSLQANQSEGDNENSADDQAQLASIVANAVSPLVTKIDELETKLNATATTEKSDLVDVIINSGKFAGLDKEACSAMPVDTLKTMASNCGTGFGLPVGEFNASNADSKFTINHAMPNVEA